MANSRVRVRMLTHHDVYNPGETPVISQAQAALFIRLRKAERMEDVEIVPRTGPPGGVLPDPPTRPGFAIAGDDEENKVDTPPSTSELAPNNQRDHKPGALRGANKRA